MLRLVRKFATMDGPLEKVTTSPLIKCKHLPVFDVSSVDKAVECLNRGGVIAVPTDTIYGLACDAQDVAAVRRLYDIKGRDLRKPISVCVSQIDQIYKVCDVSIGRDLLSRLLPGPVTVCFTRKTSLNPHLNPDTSLIGVRIPNNDFVRSVIQRSRTHVLALTSANLSCEPSCSQVNEFQHLWHLLDGVFDGGSLKEVDIEKAGSTVVDLSLKGSFSIIRSGCAEHMVHCILSSHGLNQRTTEQL